MKREREDFVYENGTTLNTAKKSERVIDKENKQKHTVWYLTQSQKHLSKIIKEYCPLCNRRLTNKSDLNASGVIKCGYCNRSTCNNANCELSTCGNCELPICNLCGNYNYSKSMSSNSMFCPSCLI